MAENAAKSKKARGRQNGKLDMTFLILCFNTA